MRRSRSASRPPDSICFTLEARGSRLSFIFPADTDTRVGCCCCCCPFVARPLSDSIATDPSGACSPMSFRLCFLLFFRFVGIVLFSAVPLCNDATEVGIMGRSKTRFGGGDANAKRCKLLVETKNNSTTWHRILCSLLSIFVPITATLDTQEGEDDATTTTLCRHCRTRATGLTAKTEIPRWQWEQCHKALATD